MAIGDKEILGKKSYTDEGRIYYIENGDVPLDDIPEGFKVLIRNTLEEFIIGNKAGLNPGDTYNSLLASYSNDINNIGLKVTDVPTLVGNATGTEGQDIVFTIQNYNPATVYNNIVVTGGSTSQSG